MTFLKAKSDSRKIVNFYIALIFSVLIVLLFFLFKKKDKCDTRGLGNKGVFSQCLLTETEAWN